MGQSVRAIAVLQERVFREDRLTRANVTQRAGGRALVIAVAEDALAKETLRGFC
jgi:hypothetical protein